ncbi:MAG: nitroreductase family protein [Clostridia bacterium]|nr:nitroreductase family protein [Clostridia bacterium]
MDFLKFAKERYSCRKFSDKPVEKEKIERIIDSGLCAPTACNYQPYKLWVLQSDEAVNYLNDNTPYMFGTKAAILVGCDEKTAWVRKFDNKNFADVDGAIVATQIMLAIHAEGLETTWVGHFDANMLKEKYPEMAEYNLIALFPIGYAAEDAVPSPLHEKKKNKAEMVKYL